MPKVHAPAKEPVKQNQDKPLKMSGSSFWTADVRIGFPYYVRAGLFSLKKVPFGWEDLGEVAWASDIENGKTIKTKPTHKICHDVVRVGREQGKVFRYCKRCAVKFEV